MSQPDTPENRDIYKEGDRVLHDHDQVKGTVIESEFGHLRVEWDDNVETNENWRSVSFLTDDNGIILTE